MQLRQGLWLRWVDYDGIPQPVWGHSSSCFSQMNIWPLQSFSHVLVGMFRAKFEFSLFRNWAAQIGNPNTECWFRNALIRLLSFWVVRAHRGEFCPFQEVLHYSPIYRVHSTKVTVIRRRMNSPTRTYKIRVSAKWCKNYAPCFHVNYDFFIWNYPGGDQEKEKKIWASASLAVLQVCMSFSGKMKNRTWASQLLRLMPPLF